MLLSLYFNLVLLHMLHYSWENSCHMTNAVFLPFWQTSTHHCNKYYALTPMLVVLWVWDNLYLYWWIKWNVKWESVIRFEGLSVQLYNYSSLNGVQAIPFTISLHPIFIAKSTNCLSASNSNGKNSYRKSLLQKTSTNRREQKLKLPDWLIIPIIPKANHFNIEI